MKAVQCLGWYLPDNVGGTELYVAGGIPGQAGADNLAEADHEADADAGVGLDQGDEFVHG